MGKLIIEEHGDVGSKGGLDFHGLARAEEAGRAVEVVLEVHALLGDLAQFGQREDLKAAGVGEDRAVPGHEAVQPAHFSDGFDTGPQIKVIGISEQDLDAQLFQHIL